MFRSTIHCLKDSVKYWFLKIIFPTSVLFVWRDLASTGICLTTTTTTLHSGFFLFYLEFWVHVIVINQSSCFLISLQSANRKNPCFQNVQVQRTEKGTLNVRKVSGNKNFHCGMVKIRYDKIVPAKLVFIFVCRRSREPRMNVQVSVEMAAAKLDQPAMLTNTSYRDKPYFNPPTYKAWFSNWFRKDQAPQQPKFKTVHFVIIFLCRGNL